jgi:hypothetical protein
MPGVVACAVVRDDPPRVFIADDEDTLQWVLALQLVASTDSRSLSRDTVEAIRDALLDEQWGEAVSLWMSATSTVVDVYPSYDAYEADDVDLAEAELQFRPLFRD